MTKKTAPPSKTAEQFVVRLPDGMRERIAESAERHSRSMNAEIVQILQNYYLMQDISDRQAEEHLEPMYVDHYRPKAGFGGPLNLQFSNLLAATMEENSKIRSLMEQQMELLEQIVAVDPNAPQASEEMAAAPTKPRRVKRTPPKPKG